MSRVTWGARTLIAQVAYTHPESQAQAIDEPDGLGIQHKVAFDATTGGWLRPLLEVELDDRIESLDTDEDGRLVVTFKSGQGSDRRQLFPLAQVAKVLAEPTEPTDESTDEVAEPVARKMRTKPEVKAEPKVEPEPES